MRNCALALLYREPMARWSGEAAGRRFTSSNKMRNRHLDQSLWNAVAEQRRKGSRYCPIPSDTTLGNRVAASAGRQKISFFV
ncbi:hypothetical protein E2C01_077525 [Portunus trituberculatus]|uniref:Uncharacterized protein n=1 Tax=Portunus trituberculatus TaxID=210409 RepID=A0A5B7ILL4_PORTR|nr:hypothetical protein [Portunus trituberculatus]